MAVNPVPVLVGLVAPWQGVDQEIGEARQATTVTRFFQTRTDNLAGDTVTVQLRNAAGDNIELTLGDGVQSAAATGSVTFAAGEKVLRRVISSGTSSMNLGGSYDTPDPSQPVAATYLTTLANVKLFENIPAAETKFDDIINLASPWISRRLQQEIGYEIIRASYSDELEATGWEDTLLLSQAPVFSVEQVKEGDSVVDPAGYRTIGDRGLQRLGSARFATTWRGGFVTADFTAGYSAVPDDIQGCATYEAAHFVKQSAHRGERLGLSGDVFSGQTDAQFREWAWQPVTQAMIRTRRRLF